MQKMRKVSMTVACSVVLLGMSALPAHAEGSRNSYISSWGVGSESNRWTDNQNDGVVTSVGLSGCHTDAIFNVASINLHRVISLQPDAKYGVKRNECWTSTWGNATASGSYYFRLDAVSGGAVLSVDSVVIKW